MPIVPISKQSFVSSQRNNCAKTLISTAKLDTPTNIAAVALLVVQLLQFKWENIHFIFICWSPKPKVPKPLVADCSMKLHLLTCSWRSRCKKQWPYFCTALSAQSHKQHEGRETMSLSGLQQPRTHTLDCHKSQTILQFLLYSTKIHCPCCLGLITQGPTKFIHKIYQGICLSTSWASAFSKIGLTSKFLQVGCLYSL